MNWFQFGRLIRSIYRRGGPLPDLEWIQRLGLLAVKLGQVHALRIDFLDREKCEHLAKLYRRAAALPAEDFLRLLRDRAVPGFSEAFESIETGPLACASVGQVHRARLKSGDPVVIKAIKRHVRAEFEADTAGLRRLFALGGLLYPPLRRAGDPEGILSDIEEYTLSELDLRREAAGQETLRELRDRFGGMFDLSKLVFPRIYDALSNEHVMVSGFVPGPTFDELLEAGKLSYETLLELFHIHGFFMFCAGTFHGDMHPGNVILSGGRLCFIDTGCISHVGPEIRRGLFRFFAALSGYDYAACAEALHSMSARELPAAGFAAFRERFLALYKPFTDSTVSQVSLTRQMMQTIRLAVASGMVFEKGIFAIIRSLMYLDGMVLRCQPDAVLLRDLRRFIAEFEPHL